MSVHRPNTATKLIRHSLWTLCLSVSLCCALTGYAQEKKIIRERSYVRFVTKQMNVPVEGQFRVFDGTVFFDPIHPADTKARFTVDTGSIDLHNEEGETEAKRKLWLDVPGFPTAQFVSKQVKALGNNHFEASGQLTLKGTAVDVVAPFTVTDAHPLRTVEGQFPLKRLRFKVGEGQWSDTDTVADEVLVRFRFTVPIS